MKSLTLRQIITSIVVVAIIGFMYFGPVTRTIFENIIISLLIIAANFFEYKGKPFSALGFYRENFNAKNLLVLAPLTAFGLFVFYVAALVPAVEMITGVPINYTNTEELRGNLPTTLTWLVVIWVTAAFGEEIIFRGYLMRQFVKFFGDSKVSLIMNMLVFCSFFGYMHMQQGITGQIVATTVGALFFIIFYLRKYDLWFMVMIHRFFNTLGILSFYFGLA